MPGVNPPSAELPESEEARYPSPTGHERLRAESKYNALAEALSIELDRYDQTLRAHIH
jgi:hypothetical protein